MGDPQTMLFALIRVPDLTDAQRITLQRDVAWPLSGPKLVRRQSREHASAETTGARLQLISMLLDAGM